MDLASGKVFSEQKLFDLSGYVLDLDYSSLKKVEI